MAKETEKKELVVEVFDYLEVRSKIREYIINTFDISLMEEDEFLHEVKKVVFSYTRRFEEITYLKRKKLVYDLVNMTKGLGILEELINDPSVSEIMVNGTDYIFIEQHGELFQSEYKFETNEELQGIIQRIAGRVNRQINISSPIVDARWKGMRVNAVFPPISLNGATLTIRKFPENPMTMDDLIEFDSITKEAAEFLHKLVLAKYNVFISGGTGSGKTTFLNILSNYIPEDERVITIEDSAELQIRSVKNLVAMETRTSGEDKVKIVMKDLIKSSLRMRPDRIVVGEVRGQEAIDMLQAMNTGHDGSLSTGHANTAVDMLTRLESMVLMGVELPIDAIRQQISSALNIVVQLGRLRDKSRRVLEIMEIIGYENNTYQTQSLYKFVEDKSEYKDDEYSKKVIGSLVKTENSLYHTDKMSMAGLEI